MRYNSSESRTLVEIIRQRLGANRLTDLIELIVRSRGSIGVVQGGALSMLLLNVYLAATLDEPLGARCPDQPQLRWVDDGLSLCETSAVGHDALNTINNTSRRPTST